ncbi:MAG: hypothetical protein ACJ8GK_04520 [Luteimonas sp.]
MSRTLRRVLFALAAASVICTACSKPEPPDKEKRPVPQADTDLRDAIQAPIDRAKAVEPAVLDAAKKQQDQIDAQTGG